MVSELERLSGGQGRGERLWPGHAFAASQGGVQRLPLHQLHGEEELSVLGIGMMLSDVVDGHHVGVGELGLRAGLPNKTVPLRRVAAHRLRDHLEGHGTVQGQIMCAIDPPHAPDADAAHNPEVVQRPTHHGVPGTH